MAADQADRKRRGAWFTPDHLVRSVVDAVVDAAFVQRRGDRPIAVIDPACGDGRFLIEVADAVERAGGSVELVGVDVDVDTVADLALRRSDIECRCDDALSSSWLDDRSDTFDLVIGNPPYLSQMSAATTRGGASRHGGGPYADAAAEFLSLGARLVRPDGGRLAYVLPQSILSARDAAPVRNVIDASSQMIWSAWTGGRDFDAEVVTCALGFEFGAPSEPVGTIGNWAHVVTERSGIPPVSDVLVDPWPASGRLGDRAWLNANFRDEYYGMVPAVGDHQTGPRLVTSGLIDPGRCRWGERSVRFAKRRFDAPRLDLSMLDEKMTSWAEKRLVPKVLIANQTPIVEAVCDPTGDCLPGVPVVTAYPSIGTGRQAVDRSVAAATAWEIAAVLTSPSVSVWAWHQRAGTGLSADSIRLGPTMLADLPWPVGALDAAVSALRAGDVVGCGRLVDAAYGIPADQANAASGWWRPLFDRVSQRA
jgi:hypothetical protein